MAETAKQITSNSTETSVVNYKPTNWLSFTGMVAPRYLTRNAHAFTKSVMTYYEDGSEAGAGNTFTDLTESATRYFYGTYQFQATAQKSFKGHNFSLMGGTSRETYDEKVLSGYRRDFVYNTYEQLTAGADNGTKDNNGAQYQWALVSAFGRFNYDYKGEISVSKQTCGTMEPPVLSIIISGQHFLHSLQDGLFQKKAL